MKGSRIELGNKERMTICEIKELLYTKSRLDETFYDMIARDIPGANYNNVIIAMRKCHYEIAKIELDYVHKQNPNLF